MPSPHPPLTGKWLAIALELHAEGQLDKASLRASANLSNKQLKLHTKLMKMRDIIDVKEGRVWLTANGLDRLRQTFGALT